MVRNPLRSVVPCRLTLGVFSRAGRAPPVPVVCSVARPASAVAACSASFGASLRRSPALAQERDPCSYRCLIPRRHREGLNLRERKPMELLVLSAQNRIALLPLGAAVCDDEHLDVFRDGVDPAVEQAGGCDAQLKLLLDLSGY